MSLSTGCVRRLYEGPTQESHSDGALVQVLEVKKIEPKAGQQGDRYRLVVSDGECYMQAMVANSLTSLIINGEITSGVILRMNEYMCNEINGRRVIILLDGVVVQRGVEQIGNPQNVQQVVNTGVPQPFGGVKTEQKRNVPNFMNKGASPSFASPSYQPGAVTQYMPIASLHPYVSRWTIKARVTSKSDKRSWSNARGDGTLFSVELLDAQGGQIKATMFKDACEKFYDVFQENQVYTISKGQLKPAQKKFNRLPNEYELTLNSDAEVTLVPDDSDIETNRFDFVPIEAIQKVEPNEYVDLLAIVTQISPISQIVTKSNQQLSKRTITLVDRSLCQVEVTLWGEQAQRWNEDELRDHPIVALKSCRVSDYGGRSLSSTFQSQLFLNPDRTESHELRAWFDQQMAQGNDFTNMQNISKQSTGSAGAGSGVSNQRKFLSDIKDEGLGFKEKPDFFTCRATITFFKHDWEKGSPPWYMACPSQGCNKKVTQEGDGSWRCDKCNRTYPDASARYILSLMVCDATGSTWLTAFNEAAQFMLDNTPADAINQYVQQGAKTQAEEIFKSANFREYLFKIRCKAEQTNDMEQRVRAHILTATPVNYVSESQYLLDEIAKYDM